MVEGFVGNLDGIIPAYAGSTLAPLKSSRNGTDHPRIRGEHVIVTSTWPLTGGSSPHTRGAQVPEPLLQCGARIIPAYAGSTHMTAPACWSPWDHPRIRGEHPLVDGIRQALPGSSPHTRGAPGRADESYLGHGIIPAYAGSTDNILFQVLEKADHPRIRGEHLCRWMAPTRSDGSSPHTRGAPQARLRRRFRTRIIPAYAGSTRLSEMGAVGSMDHPRIRGEHRVPIAEGGRCEGSSPHTRGAPHSRRLIHTR